MIFVLFSFLHYSTFPSNIHAYVGRNTSFENIRVQKVSHDVWVESRRTQFHFTQLWGHLRPLRTVTAHLRPVTQSEHQDGTSRRGPGGPVIRPLESTRVRLRKDGVFSSKERPLAVLNFYSWADR